MENEFIGEPKDFHYMQGGESINFRKTFDLNGTENDEMLRLYLRKAGLSDEIERLTIEQRRAFIYDIIKSNKMPGYWMPSTMNSPPIKPITPTPSTTSSSNEERNNAASEQQQQRNYTTMRSSVSCGSLKNLNSPSLPHRFIPASDTPPTSASTFVTSRRGIRYEISGPINFQHTAGDMNRDMTRNAFNLTASNNDNVLRKYLIERDISQEDVAGMRKTDLIRKIVQSKFTWMPTKKKSTDKRATSTSDNRLNYATISGYPEHRKSRTPLNIQSIPSSPSLKTDFTNYTLVTSRFASSPNQFPTPDEINNENPNSAATPVGVIELPPLPPGTQLPEPPPRKSQFSSTSLPTIKKNMPPPPLVIAVRPTPTVDRTVEDYDNNFSLDPMHSMKTRKKSNEYEPLYATIHAQPTPKRNRTPPPTPPKPLVVKSLPSLIPKANIGSIPPQLTPPPPPPTMKIVSGVNGVPLPNSKNLRSGVSKISTPPPPPPPPPAPILDGDSTSQTTNKSESKGSIENNIDDPRDALLESIRKGVTLKKIDQKAATISGSKPRAERRPQVMDFLTELKMGVTSRRMKNPDDNTLSSNENSEWDV